MKNFIVVGTQRTGSSAIAESVGLHPVVTCGWEWTLGVGRRKKLILAQRGLASDFAILSPEDRLHMHEVHNGRKEWLGFRWLFSASNKWLIHPRFAPALWMDRLEDFIEWVSRRPDIHIIHVVRENSMDWLKSVYLARRTRIYSKKKYPEGLKVHIPLWEALYRLKAKSWVDGRLHTIKHTSPYICIKYEDFLNDQNATANRALAFINCDVESLNLVSRSLEKQSEGKSHDHILNYNKLWKKLSSENLVRLSLESDKKQTAND